MKAIQIRDIVKAVSGTLAWGDEEQEITEVVTDSREVKPGALFVPIIGERVDAHRFIPEVLAQGASCVFSSRTDVTCADGACIFVEDTLRALQDFAAWYRSLFTIPVIGVTGSVGKTTTKEMIAAVLEKKYKTLKTFGNLNSQVGVPLMMFRLEEDTEIAVFEMGISMPDEMERLAAIARPDCAVMTNIGVSHIGNLGSRENICAEKGRIITYFSENGVLYVCGNGDLKKMSEKNIPYDRCQGNCKTIYYGMEEGCVYYADEVRPGQDGQQFLFHHPQGEFPVELSVMGTHNVNNAVVALALALRYGVVPEQAKEALKEYRPIQMRGVVHESEGMHIIDDTYNASPDSIVGNLRALFDYPDDGRRLAVLGDVLELGEQSWKLHEGIGRFIVKEAQKGRELSLLIVVGQETQAIADYVSTHSNIPVVSCENNEQAATAVRSQKEPGDWILVKGSRGMHMDEVVKQLIEG